MKVLALFVGLMSLGSISEAQNYATCSTQSRGYTFQASDYDQYRARQRVIDQCHQSPYTSNSECDYNIRCSGGNGGGGGFASISASRQYCYSDLCTYSISWRAGYGSSTVLTVQIPGETPEKLMACEGAYGQAQAPWIAPGKRYVFRVYESTACTADVGRYQSPSATANVYGGQ